MKLLRQQPEKAGFGINLHDQTGERSHHIAYVEAQTAEDTQALARLFAQAPLADQLVREAFAILGTSEPLDIRDWLRTARAYIDTVDGKE
jgi:hypothetical protein